MKSRQNALRAFTLIEVLVSMVLVGVVSAASWRAVSVLSPSAQTTNSLTRAESLLVQSQEELYSAAQNHFDILDTCNFPGANNTNDPGNNCGFANTNTTFPEFQRSLVFTPQGSTGLKQAQIQISSTASGTGQANILGSSVTLARPPNLLPGDVTGLIQDQSTGKILGAVTVVIQNVNTPNHSATTSLPVLLSGTQDNYSFTDASGRFTLQPGTWNLTASKTGYVTYQSGNIEINTAQQVQMPLINLVPKPVDAHINVTVSNAASGSPVYISNVLSTLSLYQNGVSQKQFNGGGNSFSFDIPFTNTTQQCFTIATSNAYMSKLAGNFSCVTGTTLEPQGWSSAVVGASGLNCNQYQQWTGGEGIDRICVNPGDNLNVNIPLANVPIATITGVVSDSTSGLPLSRVQLTDNWHDGTPWNTALDQTDSNGNFSITAPAEQELWPSQTQYYPQLHTQANVISYRCCQQYTIGSVSNTFSVGPLYAGTAYNESPRLNTTPQTMQCGNVQGNIRDAQTGAPLSGTTILVEVGGSFGGGNLPTDSNGNFVFQCSDPSLGFDIPAGSSVISAVRNSYYVFSSANNHYYSPSSFVVTANQNNTAPPIGLLTIGYGSISGTVTDFGSGQPLAGVPVTITPDQGSTLNQGGPAALPTVTTDAQGNFSLTNVQETWPSAVALNNPNYVQTPMNYNLSIPATGIYVGTVAGEYQVTTGPGINEFQVQAGQDTHFNIALIHKSGL